MNYRNIVANVSRIFASNRGVIIEEKDIEEDAKDIVAFEWNLKLVRFSKINFKKIKFLFFVNYCFKNLNI